MPQNNNKNKKGSMTVQEAGRKGGEATSKTHDSDFYRDIGRKGGEARSKNNDDRKDDMGEE